MDKKDVFYYTKRNITILSTAIVFLCLVIFSITTAMVYNSRVYENLDREMLKLKQKIVMEGTISVLIKDRKDMFKDKKDMFKDRKDEFKEEMPFKAPPIDPKIISIIYSGDNLVFISPNPYFDDSNVQDIKSIWQDDITQKVYEHYNFRGFVFNNGGHKILILANVDSEIHSIKQLNKSLILGLLLLLIVAIILAAFLAKKIIKPVREAYDKQVFFVQDASHEMRTPLAIIKGKVELLAKAWGETIEENFENISKIMSEIRGLEKLNSDLLLLTKEDLNSNVKFEDTPLKDFVEDISEFYIDLSEIQNKEFEVINECNDLMVKWDHHKMKRGVIILLENAFKYTTEGGKISLYFEDFDKFIKIRVRDTGMGIKKEDQHRIYDRFFRSSNIRGLNISGSGVGLSLLKSISKTLGFTIKFSSVEGKGTEFELLVPKSMK